jgi:voltage-gated potassium channel
VLRVPTPTSGRLGVTAPDPEPDDSHPDSSDDGRARRNPLRDMPPSVRRRFLALSIVRLVLSSTCFVIAYYVLPLNQGYSGTAVVELVIGLVLVAGLILFQARAVATSLFPRLRAVMALGLSIPLFVLIFATTYYKLGQSQAGSFSQAMTRTDSLYFTMTVFSSVGFGDIVPRVESARIICMVQMLGDLIFVGLAVRIILGAVQAGLRHNRRL